MFKTEDRGLVICPKHNLEYRNLVTIVGGKEHDTICPECMKEQQDAQREQEAIEQRERMMMNRKLHTEKLLGASGIPPRYLTRTFDNYRAESNKQERVLKAVQFYADTICGEKPTGAGLILAGRPGTGKTHLACALAAHAIHEKDMSPIFVTASKMIRKIRETYRRDAEHTEQEVINHLRDADLLVIDEVGIQRGTESEEHLLFEVINERNAFFKPTVLISNLNAAEMKAYIGERAMDRMREGGGKFISFDWDSYRARVAGDDNLPSQPIVKVA